jgi:hypothetical protein
MKNPKTFQKNFPKTLKTKALSFMLMSSVMATSVAAHAQDQTAEFQLVAKATAIQGEALSKKEMVDAISVALQQYSSESSSEQSSEQIANLEQAWIDLHMMTVDQAHEASQEVAQAVAQAATQAATKSSSSQSLSSTDLINASSAIFQHLNGAQFSECAAAGSIDAFFFVGGVSLAIVGATYDAHEINGTGISVSAKSLAKPFEAAGIAGGLIGFVGFGMTMSYACQ